MKILFIFSDSYNASGAFLSTIHLILELRKLNVDSLAILPAIDEGGLEICKKYNIMYKQIKSYNWTMGLKQHKNFLINAKILYKKMYNYLALVKIAKVASQEQVDLIHINTMCSYIGALVACKMKIPFIWHIREYMEEDQQLEIWDKTSGYRLMNKADRIIAVSSGVKNKYTKIFPDEKLKVVYNGINTSFYNPSKRIMEDTIVKVIIVGKICEAKGQKIAIGAIKKYVECENKNIKLRIIGRGEIEYVEKIKQLICVNNLQDCVEVSGNTSNIKEYYQWADISLMCSKCEAFGRVTVEAMMSGCLVIGSNSGGTSELIEDGHTGFLFNPNDAKDLYEKIKIATENKLYAKEIANNARINAMNKFTANKNAKEILKIYNQLID